MKTKNKAAVTKHDHPGRPRYTMKFPRSAEWTFTQLMAVNSVETDKASKRFGKGDNCSMLTLRKNLEHDMYLHAEGKPCVSANRTRTNPRSQVVEVKGVTAEPDSESGLGRRATLFRLRSVPAKDHTATKAPRKAKVKATIATAKATIEAAKAILAEPAAVVTIAPAPAPVAPVIPTAPVEAAPVAETPAPAPEVQPIANETTAPAPAAEPAAA
jgi:hypothetical protein